ncbi:hypothetical protein F5887DRAFT_922077 [Amanita rubescens]|nr:hypothetical protein F5887DRAFT_922077 [Amanita rubescens]
MFNPFSIDSAISVEILFRLFDALEVTEIFRLSKTCHHLHDLTESYWSSQISLSRILEPYIGNENEIELFRGMMRKTGAVISGSTALQAFARVQYDDSDLDLYVDRSRTGPVRTFLTILGYARLELSRGTNDSLEEGDGYPGKTEINSVDTYVKKGCDRIIQLIGTERDPVFAILQFHSTCVMNIITHKTAYSLYPFSTFCERNTLVCGPTTTKIVAALDKYHKRGWKTVSNITVDALFQEPITELIVKQRRIGDVHCWYRDLDPTNSNSSEDDFLGRLYLSWRIIFHKFQGYSDVLEGYTKPIEWIFSGTLKVLDD